jgi:hypothetical protein
MGVVSNAGLRLRSAKKTNQPIKEGSAEKGFFPEPLFFSLSEVEGRIRGLRLH